MALFKVGPRSHGLLGLRALCSQPKQVSSNRGSLMATTNHERVGKALDKLKEGLRPFIERELKARYGADWSLEVKSLLSDTRLGGGVSEPLQDVAALLVIMDRC